MLVFLALQNFCYFLEQTFFFFAGYILDYTLAPYMGYFSTAYLPGGACCGISVLGVGGQRFFLSGYMDCGLILGLTVISMFCCVPFWHRSGKFEVVVSSQCNFLKSIEFLFSKKKVDNQQTELTVNKNKYKS